MIVQDSLTLWKTSSDYLDDDTIEQIVAVYAGKGGMMQDTSGIILETVPLHAAYHYKNNSRFVLQNNVQSNYNKTRYVEERFFAWLKNGFRRTRTRYEKISENYLGMIQIASIMMYWRVLG